MSVSEWAKYIRYNGGVAESIVHYTTIMCSSPFLPSYMLQCQLCVLCYLCTAVKK